MVQLLSYQSALIELVALANSGIVTVSSSVSWPEISSEEHESSIFRQSSNPVSGLSMMEQVRLCCLAHGELAWLFHETHTVLERLSEYATVRL